MPRRARYALVASILSIVLATVIVGARVWSERRHPPADSRSRLPPSRLVTSGLPPLPQGRLVRSPEMVEEAYEFAARHPEVLRHLPCFCGCERRGHRSNLDCFVASRSTTGEVTWSPHGMG